MKKKVELSQGCFRFTMMTTPMSIHSWELVARSPGNFSSEAVSPMFLSDMLQGAGQIEDFFFFHMIEILVKGILCKTLLSWGEKYLFWNAIHNYYVTALPPFVL